MLPRRTGNRRYAVSFRHAHPLPPPRWRHAGTALLAAAALCRFVACNLHLGTGIEARDNWTRTYAVKPGATLDVRETNGRIHVEADRRRQD